jgi:O-antigen/teichoic acid export membrane protein
VNFQPGEQLVSSDADDTPPTQPPPASARAAPPHVARNVLWNWAGIVVQMLVGVVVAPFLIRRLGEENYGIWIIIGSLTGYFGLLELGVRASMGRHIAFHLAKADADGVNAILNTAVAALCATAGVIAALTLGFVIAFSHIFQIPPDQVRPAQIALLLVGLNLAVTFPIAVFDSVLWALQRFDLINLIEIPISALRMAAVFYFIPRGYGLIALAVIAIATSVAGAAIKMLLSFKVEPRLRLSAHYVSPPAARQIYSFGVWSFLLSMARRTRAYLSPLLIGAILSVQVVTLYSLAARLIGYASQFLVASTGVLTPVATALHAQDQTAQQKRLFLEGGKYCTAIALYFMLLFVFLGRPFITLWVGPHLAPAASLLNILVVGEVIPMSQWVTYSMILAMARHKLSAIVALLEVAAMVALMLILVRPMGLTGVCIAIALAGTACRGIFQIAYGCRLMRVDFATYFAAALLRPLVLALIIGICAAAVQTRAAPHRWLPLLLHAAILSIGYFAIGMIVLGGYRQIRPHRALAPSPAPTPPP